MTTAEQLQLNVLAAPLAAVDRRALSQAWYSALYGNASSAAAAPTHAKRAASAARGAAQQTPAHPETERSPVMRGPIAKHSQTDRIALPAGAERRSPRAPLAKKIERALLRPGTAARSATFRIGKGRVHVVVRQQNAGVQLVALCARGEHASVAQALMQARFALAQRGISLETKLYEEGAA
ncbi:MAG TPA: hypothetical protein VFL13_13340 [Candidatus Baltobacteraceae bacterium]|nr:hypothetical protein [Candidatus Baltobacteraceae bacterium]